MNKATTHKPTCSSFSLLHQLCNLIPAPLVSKLARDTGVIKRSRTFTPWSHVVSLLYAQLTHAIGLNDVCDALRAAFGTALGCAWRGPTQQERPLHRQPRTLRPNGPRPLLRRPRPSGKTPPRLWPGSPAAVCLSLQAGDPLGGRHRHPTGRPLSGLGQASPSQGRRQMPSPARLANLLPRFALVDTAGEHESLRAGEACAGRGDCHL
jgi:hypothetical protein